MSHYEDEDEWVPRASVELSAVEAQLQGAVDTKPTGTETLVGEVYRFAFADGVSLATPAAMDLISDSLISDIAVEILSEGDPFTDVRLGALYVDITPVAQDPCVPTRQPIEAFADAHHGFQIDFDGRRLDLGQTFGLAKVSVTGVWDENTKQVHTPRVLLEANAVAYAEAVFGASGPETCEQLARHGATCKPCNQGTCVPIIIEDFPVYRIPGQSIEPLSNADVRQASCD